MKLTLKDYLKAMSMNRKLNQEIAQERKKKGTPSQSRMAIDPLIEMKVDLHQCVNKKHFHQDELGKYFDEVEGLLKKKKEQKASDYFSRPQKQIQVESVSKMKPTFKKNVKGQMKTETPLSSISIKGMMNKNPMIPQKEEEQAKNALSQCFGDKKKDSWKKEDQKILMRKGRRTKTSFTNLNDYEQLNTSFGINGNIMGKPLKREKGEKEEKES